MTRGIYTIASIKCGKSFDWFSWSVKQRCEAHQNKQSDCKLPIADEAQLQIDLITFGSSYKYKCGICSNYHRICPTDVYKDDSLK